MVAVLLLAAGPRGVVVVVLPAPHRVPTQAVTPFGVAAVGAATVLAVVRMVAPPSTAATAAIAALLVLLLAVVAVATRLVPVAKFAFGQSSNNKRKKPKWPL